MIACRTDEFWKSAYMMGKSYCLRVNSRPTCKEYFFTPAEYKKLAIEMLSLLAEGDSDAIELDSDIVELLLDEEEEE